MNSLFFFAPKIYRHFMVDSLYRNSIYLLLNMVVMTATGFFFVLIVTKLYSQQDFGYATALIGTLALAAGISNLGMNRTIIRFLGLSQTKLRDIATMLALVSCGSLVVAVIMSLFFKSFGIKETSTVLIVMFIASVIFMSVKVLLENVFIATLDSIGVLIENTVFSIVRLVIPFLAVGFGYLGIFSAQLIAAIVAVTISIYLLKKRSLLKLRMKPSKVSMRGKWRFAFGSYTTDLVGGLPASVLPILVVAKLGPVAGSLWYVSMQMINFLLAVSSSINQAMFAEMANSKNGIKRFVIKATIVMYGLAIPLTASIYIFAPQLLRLFNGSYESATNLLRLMSIFALIGVANYITGSILGFYGKVFYLTLVNTINAAVVILYCSIIAKNLNGIAVGWMFGEIANVILFVGGAIYVSMRLNNENVQLDVIT